MSNDLTTLRRRWGGWVEGFETGDEEDIEEGGSHPPGWGEGGGGGELNFFGGEKRGEKGEKLCFCAFLSFCQKEIALGWARDGLCFAA